MASSTNCKWAFVDFPLHRAFSMLTRARHNARQSRAATSLLCWPISEARNADLLSAKSQQRPLFAPVTRQSRCQTLSVARFPDWHVSPVALSAIGYSHCGEPSRLADIAERLEPHHAGNDQRLGEVEKKTPAVLGGGRGSLRRVVERAGELGHPAQLTNSIASLWFHVGNEIPARVVRIAGHIAKPRRA